GKAGVSHGDQHRLLGDDALSSRIRAGCCPQGMELNRVKRRRRIAIIAALALIGLAGGVSAQFGRGRGPAAQSPVTRNPRGAPPSMDWEVDPHFKRDVFTFVRVQYDTNSGRSGNGREPWNTDAPDSDDNFSYRLQQMTSMKVQPHGKTLRLTDEELFDYP